MSLPGVNLTDVAGLIGVGLILAAYAAAQLHWLDTVKGPALLMNLAGSSLIMVSLWQKFNFAAFVMELAWALVAAFGLARLVIRRSRLG